MAYDCIIEPSARGGNRFAPAIAAALSLLPIHIMAFAATWHFEFFGLFVLRPLLETAVIIGALAGAARIGMRFTSWTAVLVAAPLAFFTCLLADDINITWVMGMGPELKLWWLITGQDPGFWKYYSTNWVYFGTAVMLIGIGILTAHHRHRRTAPSP